MITDMKVFSSRVGAVPFLQGDGPENIDQLQIRNITGLGPVEAAINTENFSLIDGEFFTGANIGNRNIVITVGLNPMWGSQSMSTLRQALYQYFMTKNQVKLRFESTHLVPVEISGYIESFEDNMFSKDPEINISIICPQPAFVAQDATIITGTTLALTDATTIEIDYQGSLPTGFVLYIDSTTKGTASNNEIRVVNNYLDVSTVFDINNVALGQQTYNGTTHTYDFELSTVPGKKYVNTVTQPKPVSILGSIAPGSNWLILDQGPNLFNVLATVPGDLWTMTYYAKYGGL